MTNQYMNNLYRDLLSNSPQTITIDIPADMGTGQISQIVTKQGAVKFNFADVVLILFCCFVVFWAIASPIISAGGILP